MTVIHAERLSLLLALLEGVCGVNQVARRDEAEMARILDGLRRLLVRDDLDPISSLRRLSPTASPFHRQLFSALYLVLHALGADTGIAAMATASRTAPGVTTHALDDVVRVAIEASSIVFRAASGAATEAERVELEADARLVNAVVLQAVRSRGCSSASVWLAYALRTDLFGAALGSIVAMRPAIASQALGLLLGLAESPMAAERIAAAGAIAVVSGNELTALVETGAVAPRSDAHAVWRLELSLVVRLLSVVGSTSAAFEAEIASFVLASAPQLVRPLRWTMDDPLPVALLDEMEAVVALVRALALPRKRGAIVDAALEPLIAGALALLSELVYAVQHPNTLVDQIDPEPEERAWADSEPEASASSSLSELGARPVTGPVVLAALGVICAIVDALVAFTHAFVPLKAIEIDWPTDKAIVEPVRRFDSTSLTWRRARRRHAGGWRRAAR